MSCLDIGCGGGDLAFDMGCMVGPTGTVVGTDIDHKKLEPARQEAAEQGLGNAEFQLADITETDPEGQFDLIHARFVLAHLANPAQPWPECVVRCEPVESSCWKTIFLPAGERRFLALRRTLHGDRSAEGR
jgi:2-polyprenyl-3-methyl-5-hydroxy-6-metoxy-1,4-benzoquinol methylase